MKKYLYIALCLFMLNVSTPAIAQSDLVSLGVGWYDINDNEGAADFRLEYRWDKELLWVIEPWAGLEASSDGAVYAVAGILADMRIGDNFLITPSFGAGLYGDGSGKDLGHVIEFRSQVELGFELDNLSRIGIAAGHISNAGIGDSNPGTEIVNLYYHIPVN